MEKTEVVKDFIAKLETGELDQAGNYLADNFNFVLPVPFPMGKFQIMSLLQLANKSAPDLKYNLSNVTESDDKVSASMQLSGTHTGDFMLPIPGMQPIPASGKTINLPTTSAEFLVSGDKITSMKLLNLPLEAMSGMMKNMGLNLPGMN